jgi:S1 RNA binding domain protein
MDWQVGDILEGKVSGITKFGAFVLLPGGKSGLVHISEVANAFVSDVSEHVQVGQQVKVKLLSVTPEGKINLSIKRALADEQPQSAPLRPRRSELPASNSVRTSHLVPPAAQTSGNQDFEDRLKKFMQESDSRIADSRMYAEHKQRRRSR